MLGYRTETVRDTTQDVTKDFDGVNELMEQNETEVDVFFKDEVDNSNFLGTKALPDINLPEIEEYEPNIRNPSNSQPQASSAPDCPVIKEPLLRGIKHILTLPEAMELLTNPSGHITDPSYMKDAPGGTVWLFRAPTDRNSEDWRTSGQGHHFRQTGGKPKITSVDGYVRKVAHIVLPGQVRDKRFQRISWSLDRNPRDTLVQYWGDESLSQPLVHGNSKKQMALRGKETESSPLKASKVHAMLVNRAREEADATN